MYYTPIFSDHPVALQKQILLSVRLLGFKFGDSTKSKSNLHLVTPFQAKLMVSLSAAFLNLLCIVILNQLYERLALWLTNYERPRTQTEFEDNYTFKIFLFHTLNFYSSLIYMAFFKGKFYQNPAWRSDNRWSLNNFQVDQCDPAGCLYELAVQLGVIMVGKQFFNNCIEFIVP